MSALCAIAAENPVSLACAIKGSRDQTLVLVVADQSCDQMLVSVVADRGRMVSGLLDAYIRVPG